MVPFAYSLAPPHWINQLRKIGFKHRCLLWWCIVLSSWYSKGGLQWVDMISKELFLFLVFMNLLFCYLKIISKKNCLIRKLWPIFFGWNTHNFGIPFHLLVLIFIKLVWIDIITRSSIIVLFLIQFMLIIWLKILTTILLDRYKIQEGFRPLSETLKYSCLELF